MLFSFYRYLFLVCCVSSCLWSPLSASNHNLIHTCDYDTTDICLQEASLMERSCDVQQLIQIVVQLRNILISQGCKFPSLQTILDSCRVLLNNEGIEIDEETFDALEQQFRDYEDDEGFLYKEIGHLHKKKKKKDKEIKINSKTALGFVKFIGGTLLCFVPVPIIQSAGVSLVVVGVSEMVDGARDQADKKEWEDRLEANRRTEKALEN
jgi:hypothetical protein